MFAFRFLAIIWLGLQFPHSLKSQLVINEICPINIGSISDYQGNKSPWIELFNTSDSALQIGNFSISLNSGNFEQWKLPPLIIPGKGFILVFLSGKNLVTNELHTSFELNENDGHIYLFKNSIQINSLTFSNLQPGHSIGRKGDGSEDIRIFRVLSPTSSNNSSIGYRGYCPKIHLNHTSGFYQEPISIHLEGNQENFNIKFTTDGTPVSLNASIFSGEYFIDTTKVLRLINYPTAAQVDSLLPTEELIETFFIGFETTLPVVSIATKASNFFDWNTGIYMMGPNANNEYPYYGANFWLDKKVPINFEFFETDGKRKVSQALDCEIHGGSQNRSKPMKSLHLIAKQKYGNNCINYPFFNGLGISAFKSLVLRNSSGDFNKLHCRDETVQQMMLDARLNLDLNAFRPVVVFINGEYWGVHHLREKEDKNFLFERNPGGNIDSLDLIEKDMVAIEGDFDNWNAMFDFVVSNDLSKPENFVSASQLLDLPNITDYFICETFLSNIDWPNNNMKYWRKRISGSKWRYIPMDFDITLGNYGWASSEADMFDRMFNQIGTTNKQVHILMNLLQNSTFQENFINRYADLMNTVFAEKNLLESTLTTLKTMQNEMPRHFARWGSSIQQWQAEFENVALPYIQNRTMCVQNQLSAQFGLPVVQKIEFDGYPRESGKFTVNSLNGISFPWSGKYFPTNKITLTAIPEVGNKLLYYWIEGDSSYAEFTPTLKIDPKKTFRITAIFVSENDFKELLVFPNPANNNIGIISLDKKDFAEPIQIFSLTGDLVLEEKFKLNQLNPIRILDISSLSSGHYWVKMGKSTSKFEKLRDL